MTHNIAPNLIWRILDGNVVVVSPNTGKVQVFNNIGTTIWQLLVENSSINDIENHLVTHYDVSQEQVHRDLNTFLTDLTMRGLLVQDD